MNKGFAAILERLTLLGVGLCFLASAVGHLFGDRYPFELLLNFPLQYATVAIGASALLLSVRRRLAAVISALFAAVQLLLLLPLYLSVETAHQSAATAKLMYANIFRANTRFDAVLNTIRTENPDILVVAELTPVWVKALEALAIEYPHRILMASPGAFGIGVYSKAPLTQLSSPLTTPPYPTVVAVSAVAGFELTVIATHVLPPVRGPLFAVRNEQLKALGEESRRHLRHRLLIGDLNTTPWSPYFRSLERESGLENGRRGHGLAASWPAGLTPWGIPIDHLLVSPDLAVNDLRAVEIPGSDHRAIVASIGLGR